VTLFLIMLIGRDRSSVGIFIIVSPKVQEIVTESRKSSLAVQLILWE